MPSDSVPGFHGAEVSAQLAAIVQSCHDAIIGKRLDGTVMSWNPAAEKLFHYTADEMIGTPVTKIIPADRLKEERELIHRVQSGERVESYETVRQTKDGSRVEVLLTLSPIHDENGGVVGASAVMQALPEVRRSEKARVNRELHASENRLQAVFTHMGEGLILADKHCRLLYWNPAALKMHDLSEAVEWCRPLSEFEGLFELRTLDGECLPEAEWPMARICAGQEVHELTLKIRRLDRDWERVFTYSGEMVHEGDGQDLVFLTIVDHTARHRVEEQVRASWREVHDLQLAMNEHAIVAMTDAQGRITFANDKFCEISGYSREELIGQDHRIVNSGFHSKDFMRGLWQTISAGRVWQGEIRNRRKDGRYYWVDATIIPSLGEDGRPHRYISIRTDITEHKRVEEELQQSERLVRDVLDSMLAHIAVVNEAGEITMVNSLWNEFATENGRTAAPVVANLGVGSNYFDACERAGTSCDDGRLAAQGIRDVIEGRRESFALEYPCHAPTEERWFAMSVTPLGQSRQGAVVAHRNITARKLAQATIEQQAALLDQAREAILVRDLEGRIVFWSKGAERTYGWTREEVVGKEVASLLYKTAESYQLGTAAVIERGEWNGEIEQLTKSGVTIIADARWTLLRDEDGKPKAILAINLDVTAKKTLEAQYLRAQRLESIGTLAGGIAHDLNNMLAPILMSVMLLRDKLPGAKDQELLGMLEDGATRGADLVRQILTFARGIESRQILVNPKHPIEEVCRILRDTLLQRIVVQSDVKRDVWPVLGDPTQIHQVLLNLCVNARDAMPNGGTITITAENLMMDEHYAAMHLTATAGPYVVISVQDTGTGIPLEIQEKVFDPFFTTKAVGKGTGLGLATTAAIVKSHGGFINLYSEPGKGTTFRIYLPGQMGELAASAGSRLKGAPRGNGELVLVADDEASIRQITSQTLRAFGYRVLIAADGAEALALYAQHMGDIAAVVTDLMMPIMDGVATIRALRRMNPGVKVIAATGLATEAQRFAASEAGAKHFLHKPYTAEVILRLLHDLIHESAEAPPEG